MKLLLVLSVSVFALCLGGCAEQPLISDEAYNATHGPGAHSPDYSSVLPQPVSMQQAGGY
jgi:outer membrane lipoprotein SlyB